MKLLGTLWMLDLCVIQSLTPIIQIDDVDEIILVRNRPGPPLPKVRYHCPPKILNAFFLTRILSKLVMMMYLIVKEKPDAIISYYMKASGIIALISAKLFNLPVNFNVMSGPEEYQLLRCKGKDYRLKLMEKVLLFLTKHFDSITTTGTKTKEYLMQNGIDKEILVLPASVDMEKFSPETEKKEYDLLIVARFDPAKQVHIFLQVVAKVKKFKPDIRAGIVGDGDLREELTRLSHELSIEDNVEFLGYRHNVEDFYKLSKIYILTSKREGFPMVVLEAMGCGLPCVISNVGNVTDLAEDGYNAIVVQDCTDVDGFVNGIKKLLEDKTFYRKISENAFSTVRQKFSYEHARCTWETILKQLTDKKKVGGVSLKTDEGS